MAAVVGIGLLCMLSQDTLSKPVTVVLANRVVNVVGFPEGSPVQSLSTRGSLPYVLATRPHVDQVLRLAVEAAGIRVIGPLSETSFLVESVPSALRRLSSDSRFSGAAEFLPSDKLDGRLARMLGSGADEVTAAVVVLAPEDKVALQEFVRANDGEMLEGCLNGDDSFRAKLPAALVGKLVERGDVRWVEQFNRPHLLNDYAVEPAAMNVREVWNIHGLTGTNQVVTTSDSGVDTGDVATMHRDLANRICGLRPATSRCVTADGYGHGTHTAGSIIGDGTMSDGMVRGVAHGARLWVWCCMDSLGYMYFPDSYGELFRPEQDAWPAFIHSASWGYYSDSRYDKQCEDIDTYVWKNPDFLPVFAAGNSGKTYAKTITAPATAKNVLAVGATQNLREGSYMTNAGVTPSGDPTQRATFSSRGPCKDGRTKPDVCAPGVGVLSTRSYLANVSKAYNSLGANTNYAYSCGTSMATPLVAGAVALVREMLVDRCGYTNVAPSAALMKAIVAGGAKGVMTPDNNLGWGRVDVMETLFPSNRSVKLVDRLPFASGQTFTYEVVTTNTAPLEVQLVWIDHPSTSGSSETSPKIINNLDLTVKAMEDESKTYYGNGGTAADTLNTMESVRIAEAEPNRYLITVNCSQITYDHTMGGAAALYVRGAFDAECGFVDHQNDVTLMVSVDAQGSVADSVLPSVGVHRFTRGESLTLSASEWACDRAVDGTPFARRKFLGYSLDGDEGITGTDRTLSLVITNDLAVVWRYGHEISEYRYRLLAIPTDSGGQWKDGYEVIDDCWHTNRHEFTLGVPSAAIPEWMPGRMGFRLGMLASAQTGATTGQYLLMNNGRLGPSVSLVVNEGIDLLGYYYAEVEATSDGLPYWWYRRYLWGGVESLGYDGSAGGDPDGDGFPNREEYGYDTDPVDDSSFRFAVDAFLPTRIDFTSSVKGWLIVERAVAPDGEWRGIFTNFPPRASTANSVKLDASGTSGGFYRIKYAPVVP